MSAQNPIHAVALGDLVQAEVLAVGDLLDPVLVVEDDELRILVLVGLQVLLEEVELLVIEAAIEARVENREVRILVVEAVLRLAARFLLVKGFREVRPDVMVAGREVERIVAVARPHRPQLHPLRLGHFVLLALNRIADVDDELGVHQVDLAPDASVDLRLRSAGAVAHDGETEVVLRLIERLQPDQGERDQNDCVDNPDSMEFRHAGIVTAVCFIRP